MKIFKHEKEEKLAGPTGNFAGPAPFLLASGLGPALNAKIVYYSAVSLAEPIFKKIPDIVHNSWDILYI